MKFTWRRTPPLWAQQEGQAFYRRMAARGWMLAKRGETWDRYVRQAPQDRQFWLEYLPKGEEMPPEKQALYEEAGWTLVTRHGTVMVFAADDQAPLPYDPSDPQAAQMVRGVERAYRNDLILLPVALIAVVILLGFGGSWTHLNRRLALWWGYALLALKLLQTLWDVVWGFVRLRRLRRALQVGQPPVSRGYRLWRWSRQVVGLLMTLLLLWGCGMAVASYTSQAPLSAQEDYVLVSEALGYDLLPAEESFLYDTGSDRINRVDTGYALPFYVVYSVNEVMDLPTGELASFQDCYVLTGTALGPAMARALMDDAFFADPEDFVPVTIPGLDGAWYVPGGMEYIAWAGNRLISGSLTGARTGQGDELMLAILRAAAAQWA